MRRGAGDVEEGVDEVQHVGGLLADEVGKGLGQGSSHGGEFGGGTEAGQRGAQVVGDVVGEGAHFVEGALVAVAHGVEGVFEQGDFAAFPRRRGARGPLPRPYAPGGVREIPQGADEAPRQPVGQQPSGHDGQQERAAHDGGEERKVPFLLRHVDGGDDAASVGQGCRAGARGNGFAARRWPLGGDAGVAVGGPRGRGEGGKRQGFRRGVQEGGAVRSGQQEGRVVGAEELEGFVEIPLQRRHVAAGGGNGFGQAVGELGKHRRFLRPEHPVGDGEGHAPRQQE